MVEETHTLGLWDYVVLIVMLIVSSSIGIYYRFTGGKQKTVTEYLLADRNMHAIPVAFSLMASFMSAITLLGVSNENYSFGIQFIVINFSYGLATPIAAYLYLPVFFKLQATSAYEYLEKRFGKSTRLAASLAYSLQMILYQGIVLFAPALALEALTGISKITAILVIGLVCTFYSTIGGMKAVLMTDVFQSLLMFAAIFSVIICAAMQAGGLAEIWDIASRGGRTGLTNFNPDPTERHSWFSLIVGGGVTYLTLYAVNQTQVQRYLTLRDLRSAQRALWLNWPILTALSLSTSFSGLAIYSRYHGCDPVRAGRISSSDQLMPLFVVESMGHVPGLSGLFVAGIFSASLSTVSASVNSLAAVTLEDYFKPLYHAVYKRPLPESKSSLKSKVIAFVYGCVCLAVAFSAEHMGRVLQASLTIFGAVGGPLLGLFSLGMFSTAASQTVRTRAPRAAASHRDQGSLAGLAAGLACTLWMSFGGPRPPPPLLPVSTAGCNSTAADLAFPPNATVASTTASTATDNGDFFWLYRVSYLYTCVFGLLVTLLVGLLVSLVFRADDSRLDPNLFIPPIEKRLRKKWNNYDRRDVMTLSGDSGTPVSLKVFNKREAF